MEAWQNDKLEVDTVSEVAMNGFSLHGMVPEHRSERLQRNVCMAMGAPAWPLLLDSKITILTKCRLQDFTASMPDDFL